MTYHQCFIIDDMSLIIASSVANCQDAIHLCFQSPAICTGLLQNREEAGNPVWGTGKQGACSPLTEREVSSPPSISLPLKAAKSEDLTLRY
jgi:hypothetical protein